MNPPVPVLIWPPIAVPIPEQTLAIATTSIRWRDNGLDTGNYAVVISEFGYDRMFSQTRDIFANVPDLNTMVGITRHIDRMIKISGKITGLDYLDSPVALVWA